MNPKKQFKITDIFIGIVFTLMLISIGVVITINFRPLYYMDIQILNIEEISGYSKQIILDNYNALIDYSSPFFRGELVFPSLPASESGLHHFQEVKQIFTFFYLLGVTTLGACIMIIIYKAKRRDYSYLLVSSITAILLPILVGIAILINFNKAFIIFHKLFFRNNDWLFDPITDPIIQILPETFFLHAALLIIFFILLGSIILVFAYSKKKTKRGIHYRKNNGLRL